uniref:Uncharacterized protein n=1 Tax=Mycobacterium kansasii TaxID=1768 RepID=A0A653F797_MYCKA|nr:hypothetical protein BIN_B_05316 [Mycobacterium kansasii]
MHAGTAGLEQVEGAVAHPRIFLGDHPGVADVGLAHLEEHPAWPQQAQRRVDEFTGERVQYDVHAAAAGDRAEFVLEFQTARIGDMIFVKTHGAQGVPFALAGGGEHLQAQMPGQLYGCHTDSAGGGMHQHPLTRLDVGQVDERVVRGGEDGRDGGGFGV